MRIQRYSVVYAKVSDKTTFEELEELKEEVEAIKLTKEYDMLVNSSRVKVVGEVETLLVSKLKS